MPSDKSRRFVRVAAAVLACALTVQPLAAIPPQAPPAKLKIVIVEGEGAINNIRQRTAREPIVQVEDENNKPVAGAAVLFLLPGSGPGGTFPGGASSLRVVTDRYGQAVAKGFRHNGQAGKFQIEVSASHEGATATTEINMANAMLTAAAAGGVSGKVIAILAIVGGAAAAGAVVMASGGGNGNGPSTPPGPTPPGPTPTTISAGAPSVTGP